MTDLDKLKKTYSEIGVDFVIREDGDYQYLFIGKSEHASDIRWMNDNFETTDLDTLTLRNKFFEFEKGKLASW